MNQKRQSEWHSIKEYGSQTGIKILLAAYSLGGRWLLVPCLFPVMLFFFLLRADARHASLDYLRQMHRFQPQFPAPGLRHSFYHFWTFGLALLDKFSVWMGKITRNDVTVHNTQIIDELIARGQGGVILISHLGNFEICHALSQGRKGMRLTILHHSHHTEKFNALLEQYSGGAHVELVQVTELDMRSAIDFSEKISRGEFIAIATDRVPISNAQAVQPFSFLGKQALFPTGPFVLAMALQAPILTLHCIKLKGRYHIHFDYLSVGENVPRRHRQQRLHDLMQDYIQRLETFCVKAPWQWFNFYPFWTSPNARNTALGEDASGEKAS